jgi:hypothetical protein
VAAVVVTAVVVAATKHTTGEFNFSSSEKGPLRPFFVVC